MSAPLDRIETVNPGTGDVELGITDAIGKHFSRHVVQRQPVTVRKLEFERRRPHWLRECIAEATGVFFYTYCGVASVAATFLATADPTEAPIAPLFGSILQIGLGFGFGIAFAIIVCAPTSGGHFNPAITLCLAFWQGFPKRKIPYFIFSQIFGSFMAGLLIYAQFFEQIHAFTEASIAAGRGTVYAGGPASIFVAIPQANQTNLGYLFMIELFVDSTIAMIIWACIDPANPFISATTAPFAIGLGYSVMVWGFANVTISTNMARDLGCRIVAAIFFGGESFSYHNYSWISILVNIPATFLGTAYYELVFRDSLQTIGKGNAVHEHGEEGLQRHITKARILDNKLNGIKSNDSSYAEY